MNADAANEPARIPGSKLRPVQNLKPGYWWFGDYEDADNGGVVYLWSEVSTVMESTRVTTGERFVRVYGTATDGGAVQLVQRRGFAVESVTEQQAKKAALTVGTQ